MVILRLHVDRAPALDPDWRTSSWQKLSECFELYPRIRALSYTANFPSFVVPRFFVRGLPP
jgi:hypothetical protein